MRRILALAVLCLALAGCTAALPATPTTTGSTTPASVTVPDEVGKNAAVALDELHRLGFTNVDLGTVDGHKFVVLPQNWTVRTQSSAPGTRLPGNAKIVLGCARNG
jgi:beta-lactam-binding protein with PASTA domain